MSVDHSSPVKADAPFPHVRPGHFVIVGGQDKSKGDWWMGQVIVCEGGARDPKVKSLFHVADVDTGIVRWINADEASDVMWSMDGWPSQYERPTDKNKNTPQTAQASAPQRHQGLPSPADHHRLGE